MTIFERVQDVACQVFAAKPEEVTLATNLIENLGADSLDWMEMVMECEEEFDVTIPDTAYQKFKTIGDIVSYLEEKGAK